ncbi:Trp biosynthesis associated, transmembrane protein, Oprn/Chp [Cellulomonas flavigena DSM 20109]|uniref:Trp biosynthesis associated, transmembrane protein, Oprn/Chp n=1 Tax=Cellulomonas flavigena (strain ATCC 482 / DSM 20109 / BCRC 11376 / JCM 18109 / NBRC 3775 / NCIMB 8073 / NRS 134) TaxID=446466 RepID=D5UF89_CELFN|nr:Trp biosynthesis-associated membrane protein [Cellulomonas flavigena]ADG74886.1 Trp biosynthesis associated, transmembrane protein, Oprn/Chp [Cellulomonas flavigena DSM 20109]
MSDAPTGADAPAGADGAPVRARARRGRWVLLLLVAAGLVALVSAPTWVTTEGTSTLDGTVRVVVTGAQAAPQTRAGALVLLAAAGAVALVGRVGRWVVAAVTAGAGALVVGGAAAVLLDPAGAATTPLAQATGVVTAQPVADVTAGPAAAVGVGLLAVLLAVALLRAPGAWEQRSRRHERLTARGGVAPAAGPPDERSDWDALSRGDDPS